MSLSEVLKEFDAGKISVPVVAKEIVGFFQKELSLIEQAEKKEEQIQITVENLQQLALQLNPYINRVSVNEETLIASLDNPDLFDKEEWQAVQESKGELSEIVGRLLLYLATEPPAEEPKAPVSEKRKPPPKSKWMKM